MFVLPGSDVTSSLVGSQPSSSVTLGSGLLQNRRDGSILTTTMGHLHTHASADGKTHRSWVAPVGRFPGGRYVPGVNDVVVGTVVETLGDRYSVDIGAARLATLDALAFDGASKRNAPELEVGAVVFARVLSGGVADASEPVLTCEAPNTGNNDSKKDWTTGEAAYGELRGNGAVARLSLPACRGLLANVEQPNVLEALSRVGPFEMCVGLNGRVFVDAQDERVVVLVMSALRATCGRETLDARGAAEVVQEMARELGLSAGKLQKHASSGGSSKRPEAMSERASKRSKASANRAKAGKEEAGSSMDEEEEEEDSD